MNKRKKQNRIDRHGETIIASRGVDLDSMDLEDLVERPESSPSKEKENLENGAQVEFVLEFKSQQSADTDTREYTSQLVSSVWQKSGNFRILSIRMSLDWALEIYNLASYTTCAVKKLNITYIGFPSAMLTREKDLVEKHAIIHLAGVELKEIANSTAMCVLTLSPPNFKDILTSGFMQTLFPPNSNMPHIGQPMMPAAPVYPVYPVYPATNPPNPGGLQPSVQPWMPSTTDIILHAGTGTVSTTDITISDNVASTDLKEEMMTQLKYLYKEDKKDNLK